MARRQPSALLAAAVAAAGLVAPAAALTLSSSRLTVVLDDAFPRPLNYTHAATGETLRGALTGWGFHAHLSVNSGQVTCGEAGLLTTYASVTPSTADFTVACACVQHWGGNGSSASVAGRAGVAPSLVLVDLTLTGTVSVADDPAVAGAGVFSWTLQSADLSAAASSSASASASADPLPPVTTLQITGMEVLSFHPVPVTTPGCMYTATMSGTVPSCGGDGYFVDSYTVDGIDEWWSGTWDSSTVQGTVDMNELPGTNSACLNGVLSRHAPGPISSIVAGGWTPTRKTGIAALSSEKHLPFWTGSRSYDAPGRCNVFTVAPSPIHAAYFCGPGLPYTLTVGVFPDVTQDGDVSSDDLYFWRRLQYPRADVLYRTTLPYKLQIDMTSYSPQWDTLPFLGVLDYVRNISLLTDAYPQTPILVGWQGLGHDTLYPGWDIVNIRPEVGGSSQLFAMASQLAAVSGSNRTTLSFHVNADEAYTKFNGTTNPDMDMRICRLNIDHSTAWFMNTTALPGGFQTPDAGLRCSISKAKDNALFGRYDRYARFFSTVPGGLKTIHSDAWRNVGASWEPEPVGFIDWQNEERCGSEADSAFWAAHGMSMGIEGNDGQASDFLGVVSFLYHSGSGWDPAFWGRWVSGTQLGWDDDVSCINPEGGWSCGWERWSDNFWLTGALYQLALTDELLGTTTSTAASSAAATHRFARGGRVLKRHTAMHKDGVPAASFGPSDIPVPSTWPFGGDSIPVADDFGGVLVPRVTADGEGLVPDLLYAYQLPLGPIPDPSCPLFSNDSAVYTGANNTALGSYSSGYYAEYELDPTQPELEVVQWCNSTCWANASCAAWDLIKVTRTSGKVKPTCYLYASATGCNADPNQWAGVKLPLPVPAPQGLVNKTWTLPLSWEGHAVTATSLTPEGPVPNSPELVIDGRQLLILNMQPGYPVRLQAAGLRGARGEE